jgi:hypothetical protein
VEELKALLMNTATDLYARPGTGLPRHGLSRVGAGLVDLSSAVDSQAVAFAVEPEGLVSVSFGLVEVAETAELSRTVEVVNRGTEDLVFDLGYDATADAPGVEVVTSVTTVSVEAGGTATFEVELEAEVSEMSPACDPSVAAYIPMKPDEGATGFPDQGMAQPRHYLSEEAGYVTMTPSGGEHPTLRLPVHAIVRPVSTMATST